MGNYAGGLPLFTRLRRNRINVCTGYNAGVRESDHYRFIRYNETHDDGDGVAIASDQQK